MGRIGIYLEDDLEKRLKEYAFKVSGNFRSQSDIVAKAVREYLDNHESELENGKERNPLMAVPALEPILA